ncbi:peptidase inhibitor family I36 protein [Streptomyces sp. NPDC001502]|uniref:peptidase inhibitor family I36 protein n=1 Tax=Streptomyces sp. NPDC001502 TaxID=3364578 RepID=UPI0036BACE15
MRAHHLRTLFVAGAVALVSLTSTTPAQALPACPANAICLWRYQDGTGELYVWRGGYVDLPSRFVDHVGSFRANRSGAFIDWATGKECRPVHSGDYASNYSGRFGSKIDAVGNNC